MTTEQTLQNLTRLLAASLLAGLLGGGLLVFLTTSLHRWCWSGLVDSHYGFLDSITILQAIMLGILLLFFAGMLAVALHPGKTPAQAVVAGVVSGCTVFLVNEVHILIADCLGHGSTDLVGDLVRQISYLLLTHPVPLLYLALFMAALAVLGALFLFSIREKAGGPDEKARASRMVLGTMALFILALTFLPPLVAHAMPGTQNTVAAIGRTVISAERTAPDTLVLTAREVPAASALADPHFSVYLDGVEVSDADAAAAIAVSVEPADGLQAFKGSQAAWQGAAVHNNGTPVNVAVAAHGADGSKLFVFDRRV
ncbi:hypothetical protein E2N92_00585 [Methanofollis formosanus]|uniref:Uncharacterized protein n=1 Tax=Methanofollis formosanus TaxID=299308 RepID=A0A8G1EED7_9EURY|nr:hypothetical protein [Methanofollis formosanus]QYZ78030.1 hypothetical protein E2N92_00585 [Methanofollis formosanus]